MSYTRRDPRLDYLGDVDANVTEPFDVVVDGVSYPDLRIATQLIKTVILSWIVGVHSDLKIPRSYSK
jgi:hypothetical protein